MFVFIKVCGEGIYIRLVSILLPNLLVSCGGDGGNEGHASLFMVTVLSPSPLFFPPSSSLSLPPLVLSPFPSPPLSSSLLPSFSLSFSLSSLFLSGKVGHASERVLCGCHHSPRGESRTAGIEGDTAEIHQTARTVQ